MFKLKLKAKIIIAIFTILIDLYCVFIYVNMKNSNYLPVTTPVDLNAILSKHVLNTEDYSLLYSQTGLSREAVDDILAEKNGISTILGFQNNYFSRIGTFSEKVNPFTVEESIMVKGVIKQDNLIAPLKNGDLLFTKSVLTLFWRHGHCGIVIDAKNGIVLESLTPGTISTKQHISKWQHYTTVKVMRLKGATDEKRNEIAQYAAENLTGIKYKILALKKYDDKKPNGENCSQMIWLAFHHFGYDLDSNKGIIVTPEDIAKSNLLEVVQNYGFNPKNGW